jgi:uncharacterized ferritin-like protein (DUF455 family)
VAPLCAFWSVALDCGVEAALFELFTDELSIVLALVPLVLEAEELEVAPGAVAAF